MKKKGILEEILPRATDTKIPQWRLTVTATGTRRDVERLKEKLFNETLNED